MIVRLPLTVQDVGVDNANGAVLVEVAALDAMHAGGLPTRGDLAAGTNAFVEAAVSPDRICSHLHAELDLGNDALISLDGGASTHIRLRAGLARDLDGLAIPATSSIAGKNAVNGAAFTNLRVEVW